jgi:hypothetical protein
MDWITRERPKIDRVACPWLITRFVDPSAVFHFVAAEQVRDRAEAIGATPFDVEGVELSHDGPRCSFDAFLNKYDLHDPALREVGDIVRGADTARLDIAPECAGLLAVSLGLSQLFRGDHVMLRHGFVLYDALYAWARYAQAETHTWNPQRDAR